MCGLETVQEMEWLSFIQRIIMFGSFLQLLYTCYCLTVCSYIGLTFLFLPAHVLLLLRVLDQRCNCHILPSPPGTGGQAGRVQHHVVQETCKKRRQSVHIVSILALVGILSILQPSFFVWSFAYRSYRRDRLISPRL